eukprot:TRINITY_DN9531_c1_g1_i1.p1 TRINITY_DN9531_c1_g1~~TRINITY_DN9531_c1_g1_i1.p1  ORF type:complete len:239 (-),score=77.97 TRINITY_DN9531_c1_g1_i1:343-1059(-)
MAVADYDDEVYRTLMHDELRVEVIASVGPDGRTIDAAAAAAGAGGAGAESAAAGAGAPVVSRKRKRRDLDPFGAIAGAADDDEESSSDDDRVQVVLCDDGASGGGMDYYLGRRGGRGAAVNGAGGHDSANNGALVPLGAPGALAPAERLRKAPTSKAELVQQDESVEAVLAGLTFQMDVAEMADTQWRQLGANQADYFNFDLDEKRFKEYFMRQVKIRLEARQRRKIGGGVDGRAPLR